MSYTLIYTKSVINTKISIKRELPYICVRSCYSNRVGCHHFLQGSKSSTEKSSVPIDRPRLKCAWKHTKHTVQQVQQHSSDNWTCTSQTGLHITKSLSSNITQVLWAHCTETGKNTKFRARVPFRFFDYKGLVLFGFCIF